MLLSIGLGNEVLAMTPKTQTIKQKINKEDCIKLQKLLHS